jgi:hypothetical protein
VERGNVTTKRYRRVERVTRQKREVKGWAYKKTLETRMLAQATFMNSFNSNVEGKKRVVYQLGKDNYWVLDTD